MRKFSITPNTMIFLQFEKMAAPRDPLDFSNFKKLVDNDETRKGYELAWRDLCKFVKITAHSPATYDKYLAYLEYRREGSPEHQKLCGTSMQKLLSSLNSACQHIYRYDINKVS